MISRIRLTWTLLTALLVMSPTAMLLAQEAAEGEEASGPSWVLNYILVALFIVLGVMAVCYATTRFDEELRRKELRELQEKNKAG